MRWLCTRRLPGSLGESLWRLQTQSIRTLPLTWRGNDEEPGRMRSSPEGIELGSD
jgi:hypothetical protein